MPLISCAGLQTHYIAPKGLPQSSSGVVVLLVHGAGGSHRHWNPMLESWQTQQIRENFYPVALDLPGHSETEGTVLESVEAEADFINSFLDALEVKTPIAYVGHSAGGILGLQFALNYPKRVRRLTLIATSACIQLHPDFLQQALSGQWDYDMMQQSFSAEVAPELKQLVLDELQSVRLAEQATDFMGLSQCDLRDRLSEIHQPTLVITGDDDVIISPRKSRLLQQALPKAELVMVKGAGHYVHVEQAESVTAALASFLQRILVPVGA
ncbi:alpha/beta fold hydrolase [Leptolyngbya sp. AN03gr2]|uniref:alpha/beta fold hydrolase n=1 Tax=unclassified Leptolyngbya TaxID=2650499 RepID=UPI003D314831